MSIYKICDYIYKICDHLYKWVCDLRKMSYATKVEVVMLENVNFNIHQSHPTTWDAKTEECQVPLILKEKAGLDKRKRVM